MIDENLTTTRDRLWSPVLEGVHATGLDCLQANLAALADREHGTGTHLALGASPRFGANLRTGGPPSTEPTAAQRVTEAENVLGLRVTRRWDDVDGPALRRISATEGPLYVIADAYTMGWLPHFGEQHQEHSFLLTRVAGACTVVDAFQDETPWGSARPGIWRLSPAEFDEAVPVASAMTFTARPVPVLDPAEVLAANAEALSAATPEIDAYVAAVRAHADHPQALDRLVLDTWLFGRARLLHAAWLATATTVPDEARESAAAHARAWQSFASRTFLTRHRSGGRGIPDGLVDQLAELVHEDAALTVRMAEPKTGATQQDPAVHSVVVEELATVLELRPTEIEATAMVRDLPRFDSFRFVAMVELVEARLSVELDAGDLATAVTGDVGALCETFTSAVHEAGGKRENPLHASTPE